MRTAIDDLLRQANPVTDLTPHTPERQAALLERIVSPQPMKPRPGRRSLVFAAALAALTALALVATSTTRPNRALAGVELERDGSGYRVIVTDVERDAKDLTEALHAYGFNITLELLPASPSLVGSIVGGSAAGGSTWIEPLHDGPCRASAGCEVGFHVDADWHGTATVELARAARPGERYLASTSAFNAGELLGCAFRPGVHVAQLLPELQRRGIAVQYRPEGVSDPNARIQPDWIVTDVTPDSASSAFLFAAPRAPEEGRPGLNC